jgi:hypothetical protein
LVNTSNVLESSQEGDNKPINYMHIWLGGVHAYFAKNKFCHVLKISFHYLEIFLETWIDNQSDPNLI